MQHKICDEIDAATRVIFALFFIIIYLMHLTLSWCVQKSAAPNSKRSKTTKQTDKIVDIEASAKIDHIDRSSIVIIIVMIMSE